MISSADASQWGGGVVAEFFRDLQLRNQMFTPHSVIFVGRDTHLNTTKIRISCAENNLTIKFPQNSLNSVSFFNISVRPGDHAPFLETHGNSVRLGTSVNVEINKQH